MGDDSRPRIPGRTPHVAASWPRAGCVCRCALPLRLPLRWHTTCHSSDGKCTAHAPCSVTYCALTGRLEDARLGARHLYVSCAAPTLVPFSGGPPEPKTRE